MKAKIMVADDDAAILDATSLVLADDGYDVRTTANGETISKIELELPDVLLLDIWMSGQDGREICRYLKQQDKTRHIPIIMISANRDTAIHARECGADDFLAKPFDINDLLKKVEKYAQKVKN